MIYSYTVDLPYSDPVKNRREFVKLPRNILLPPYLTVNPFFVQYMDGIDEVFDATVEQKIDGLRDIRNMWVTTRRTEAKIADGQMVEFIDWGGPDRATVVNQVNLLGMKLANANLVDENSYRTLSRFLGLYWFGKGKDSAIDFMNFCLKTEFEVDTLFTQDYVKFYKKDDPEVGAMVFDNPPGPWYPTTHVRLTVPGSYGVDPITIANFFYEIANYNLVLEILQASYEAYITSQDSDTLARIVCVAGYEVTEYTFASDLWILPITSHGSETHTLIDMIGINDIAFNFASEPATLPPPTI